MESDDSLTYKFIDLVTELPRAIFNTDDKGLELRIHTGSKIDRTRPTVFYSVTWYDPDNEKVGSGDKLPGYSTTTSAYQNGVQVYRGYFFFISGVNRKVGRYRAEFWELAPTHRLLFTDYFIIQTALPQDTHASMASEMPKENTPQLT